MNLKKHYSPIKNGKDSCLVFAHRGSKCNRPENTLAAFQEAIRVKADGIELDVHLSKDHQIVVIHDEKVNRTSSGKGSVGNMTLAELKLLDAGSWFHEEFQGEKIPTLKEVLNLLIAKHFVGYLNIEIKTDRRAYPGIEEKLLELIHSQKLPFTIIYSSFNLKTLRRLHALGVKDELAYLAGKRFQKVNLSKAEDFIDSFHLKKAYVIKHPELMDSDKRPVRLWNINSEKDISLALQHNIAGFFTDYPEKAIKIKNSL